MIQACTDIRSVQVWKLPEEKEVMYDSLGRIEGRSLHRRYLYCLTGPSLKHS